MSDVFLPVKPVTWLVLAGWSFNPAYFATDVTAPPCTLCAVMERNTRFAVNTHTFLHSSTQIINMQRDEHFMMTATFQVRFKLRSVQEPLLEHRSNILFMNTKFASNNELVK